MHGPKLARFWANIDLISNGTRDTITYRLCWTRVLGCFPSHFDFWTDFGEKMGEITTRAPKCLWHRNPTNFVDLLGQVFSRNFRLKLSVHTPQPPSPLFVINTTV